MNFSGGTILDNFGVNGSLANISGGWAGELSAVSGSEVNITGGTFGDSFGTSTGAHVNIYGGDFRLNGEPIAGLEMVGNTLPINPGFSSVFSGTLSDGTPFAFSYFEEFDAIANGTVTLTTTALSPIGPALTTVPMDPAPPGIRSGQTLIVEDGGVLADHFNAGRHSTVIINGGQVRRNFEAVDAQITISGGTVGDSFDAFHGSVVNITGGTVGDDFAAHIGSDVNLSGGTVGDRFSQSSVYSLREVNIHGGEYRLNGVPIAGLETIGSIETFILPGAWSVLSGTLADGTPFAFSLHDYDGREFTLNTVVLPPIGPPVIMLPTDTAPLGIGNGQTLIVEDGGTLGEHFNAGWGSTVMISGGQVLTNFEAVGAQVTISGGSIDSFDAYYGSEVDITGGAFYDLDGAGTGGNFEAFDGSVVNINGGTIGIHLFANSGSEVNISGGSVGRMNTFAGSDVIISGGSVGDITAHGDIFGGTNVGVVNISGGTIGQGGLTAMNSSEVNISGGSFYGGFKAFPSRGQPMGQ